tara:strand:+ start:328 stop:942 length:615 start_codon:yes stop_codon:yes gene_type:complete
MNLEEINKQAENKPLSKEELKKQFVEKTKELGIKHTFNFDEAYEIGQELVRRKTFRNKIVEFEKKLNNSGIALSQKELHEKNPVKHSFADGCYIREIFNPAGELLVTKIHKKEHPFFLMKGKMSILTDNGIIHIQAPYHGITKPGTKRIIYTHTDCIFVTVHATNKTNVAEIEKEVIAEDFNDPTINLETLKKLEKQIVELCHL